MDQALNIFDNLDKGCDNGNSGNNREPSIYIFGYGSLVWNPGFEYSKCITGCKSFVIRLDEQRLKNVFLCLNRYQGL